MRIVDVLIERKSQSLNRPFSYYLQDDKEIVNGTRVLINFANQRMVGYVVNNFVTSKTLKELEEEYGFTINPILEIIDDKPLLNDELIELADKIASYYLAPKISVLQCMLPPSLKPSITSLKAPKIAYDIYLRVINENEDNLTSKQIEVLRLIKNNENVLRKDIKSKSIVKTLLEKKYVEEYKVEKRRLKLSSSDLKDEKELTSDQKDAKENILKTDKTVTLLQGVTGSGKSEVYLALSKEYLKENKNVLMLVPEISLTPKMVEYFQSRFGEKVAILHSDLTPGEKYDEYRRIKNGDANIVIGARSAIFAPLENIGLIILDEEHVETYKQDSLPYYHAKDIAILRAKYHHAKVVLGSATPCLETKIRALKGIYNVAYLNKRINQKELPKTTIIDMSKGYNLVRESYIFSKILIEKIKLALERKEQIILLINRRGYSGYITCRSCGHIFMCPNCNIALTYHKNDNMLKCHHCGYVELSSETCPKCGSKYLSHSGFGSEKIVQEINKLFPNARVLRLDSDIGEVRNNIRKTITSFSNHEAEILVGTQMIAKGHDFPNVTLVGIVLADIGLSMPSFRSSERTFELITQAVGRCGRSDKNGEAIIQTYNPFHYAIQFGAKQDYESFFKREMKYRKLGQYPPYTFLISIEVNGKNEENVINVSSSIVNDLLKKSYEDVTILGPTIPYIYKENQNYRRLILIKYKNGDKIRKYVEELSSTFQNSTSINLKINVDPYSF